MNNLQIFINNLEGKHVFIDNDILLNYYEFLDFHLMKYFDKIKKVNISNLTVNEIEALENKNILSSIKNFLNKNEDKINFYSIKNNINYNTTNEIELYKLSIDLMFKARNSILILSNNNNLQIALLELNNLEIINKKNKKSNLHRNIEVYKIEKENNNILFKKVTLEEELYKYEKIDEFKKEMELKYLEDFEKKEKKLIKEYEEKRKELELKHKQLNGIDIFKYIKENDIESLKDALNKDIDINERDYNECTIIHFINNIEIFNLLAKSGAYLNVVDSNEWSILHYLVFRNNLELIIYIVENYPEVDFLLKNNDGIDIFSYSIIKNYIEISEFLLSKNIDLESQDKNGNTPLHHAVKNIHYNIVMELLNRDVDLDLRDDNGWTALHWACYIGSAEIVSLLIQYGSDKTMLTARDFDDGSTIYRKGLNPYEIALETSNPKEIGKLLLNINEEL